VGEYFKKAKSDFFAVVAVTFLFYSITYAGSLAVFNIIDFFVIPLFIVIVCLAEVIIIKLVISDKYRIVQNLALGLALFVNIFVVNLGFNDDFISLPFTQELLGMIFFIILFFLIFNILYESKNVRKYFASFVFIFSILSIMINFFVYHESKHAEYNYANQKMIPMDKTKLRSYPEYEKNIKYDIKLNDKPNIIILTFDALVDEKTYQILTKRNKKIFMYKVFEERMTPLKNHFSDEISTRHSLSALLALTPEILYTLPFDHGARRDFSPRFRMFNGQTPSPLFEIFKSNGYEISSFFVDRHTFGTFKGDYVDNFLTLPVRIGYESSVCTLIGHRTRYIGFFGYCEVLNRIKNIMAEEDNIFWQTSMGEMEFNHYYFKIPQPYDLTKSLDNKDKPQLLFGHTISPGHIGPRYSPNFRNKSDGSYREYVLHYESIGKYNGALIEKIADHLEKTNKKRDTIVYVMGDHGMMLSQRMTWTQDTFVDEKFSWDKNHNLIYGNEKSLWINIRDKITQKEDQEYTILDDKRSDKYTDKVLGPALDSDDVIIRQSEPYRRLDRYSTYGGFISDHKCAKKAVEKNEERGYSTPQLVMHDLISCLSDYVVTPNNKEYIQDFKREKTLHSQAYPVCIRSHSPCSKECIELNGNCFAAGSDPYPYKDLLYE
tara:strand:+ start:3814 stop:5793 length:1980 start_codon:yes stop_codon:yes gene_type:complete